jgi:hypothetical protein
VASSGIEVLEEEDVHQSARRTGDAVNWGSSLAEPPGSIWRQCLRSVAISSSLYSFVLPPTCLPVCMQLLSGWNLISPGLDIARGKEVKGDGRI